MVHVLLSLCHLGSRKRKGYRCIFMIVKETPETVAFRCSSMALEWSELASGRAS